MKIATIASQASAKLLGNAEKYEGDRDGWPPSPKDCIAALNL